MRAALPHDGTHAWRHARRTSEASATPRDRRGPGHGHTAPRRTRRSSRAFSPSSIETSPRATSSSRTRVRFRSSFPTLVSPPTFIRKRAFFRAAGTVRYQPPEAALGYATTASDVFAVGLILFELLTGVSAFPLGDSYALGTSVGVAQAIRRTRESPAQPPSRFRANVGPDLDAVISRALALRPADRFGSAKEFEHALVGVRWLLGVSQDRL